MGKYLVLWEIDPARVPIECQGERHGLAGHDRDDEGRHEEGIRTRTGVHSQEEMKGYSIARRH